MFENIWVKQRKAKEAPACKMYVYQKFCNMRGRTGLQFFGRIRISRVWIVGNLGKVSGMYLGACTWNCSPASCELRRWGEGGAIANPGLGLSGTS